jgi:radical SAM superfamily enzyme YgiQ (UPF0313 family)
MKPLGLLIIGSVLQENGYAVSLLDCLDRSHPALLASKGLSKAKNKFYGTGHFNKEIIPKPEILKDIPRLYGRYGIPFSIVKNILSNMNPPDLIFITSGMTYWYPGIVDMISLLKTVFKGIPVVLGGIYATLCYRHAKIKSGADKVIAGEGEITALKLADQITRNHSNLSKNLHEDYFHIPLYNLYDNLESAAILTSKGCTYRCPFCASHLLSNKFIQYNPLKVVDEIERLYLDRGVREIVFYDDALLLNKDKHIIPILEGIIKNKIRVHFHTPNGLHPKMIDSKLAKLMRKAGFMTIRLSYETSNKDRQKTMGFKVLNHDLVRAVRVLCDAGFEKNDLGSYVLMGIPGQKMDEVIESMEFVFNLGIKSNLASYTPIPGTQSWQECVENGYIRQDIDPLLTNNSIFPLRTKENSFQTFVDVVTFSKIVNRIVSLNQKKEKENDDGSRNEKSADHRV